MNHREVMQQALDAIGSAYREHFVHTHGSTRNELQGAANAIRAELSKPAAVPGFFTSMAVSRIKRAVIDWETGLVSATESMSDVRAALAYADQQPMPPAPAVSPVDVEAVREVIAEMHRERKSTDGDYYHELCGKQAEEWANELARAIGDEK